MKRQYQLHTTTTLNTLNETTPRRINELATPQKMVKILPWQCLRERRNQVNAIAKEPVLTNHPTMSYLPSKELHFLRNITLQREDKTTAHK